MLEDSPQNGRIFQPSSIFFSVSTSPRLYFPISLNSLYTARPFTVRRYF